MNKSGSIDRGNLYLSVISCQVGKLVQLSVKSRLWLWKDSLADGLLIPSCQQLTMWFILKGPGIIWGLTNNQSFVSCGGGGGRNNWRRRWFAPCLVACLQNPAVSYQTVGMIQILLLLHWVMSGFSVISVNPPEEKSCARTIQQTVEQSRHKKVVGASLRSSSIQRRQNVREHWC
jgi:hypothetical protein